ncbi:hypothetical protein CHUAL_003492 [Chamberlinius hualienensis]
MFSGNALQTSDSITLMSDGTLTIKNVTSQIAGNYSCHVHNELGEDEITHRLTVLAPPSPPQLQIQSTTTNSIEIQWKMSEDKQNKLKGFTIYVRKHDDKWKEINVESSQRTRKIDGLECGTKYDISMAAHNSIGTGDKLEMVSITTNGSVPTPPSKSDLIEESTNAVSLYLNTWKSNGCPIQYYVVEYAQRSVKEWNIVSKSLKPEMRRLMIPGLRDGTWYTLRMTAHNAAGSSMAEYNFATLSEFGATIAPEIVEDEKMGGLVTYLNFYVIIPVSITAFVLILILCVSCFYVKSSNNRHKREIEKRLSVASNIIRRDYDASTLNYSYIQRPDDYNTMRRGPNSDPIPYATSHLTNQPPPLPPPNANMSHTGPVTPRRNEIENLAVFQGINQQFFPPPPASFLSEKAARDMTTTFSAAQDGKTAHNAHTYANNVDGKELK